MKAVSCKNLLGMNTKHILDMSLIRFFQIWKPYWKENFSSSFLWISSSLAWQVEIFWKDFTVVSLKTHESKFFFGRSAFLLSIREKERLKIYIRWEKQVQKLGEWSICGFRELLMGTDHIQKPSLGSLFWIQRRQKHALAL